MSGTLAARPPNQEARPDDMTMLRLLGAPMQGLDYSLLHWEWLKEHR